MIPKATYLIKAQAILFVVFILSCFMFNRFAVDDYYFIGEINNKSFSEIYSNLHLKWHGRWASNFLLLFFIQFYKIPLFLTLYNIITYLLLLIVSTRLFKSIDSYYNLGVERNMKVIYSIVFTSVFFFSSVNPNETWFWFTSSVVYFWSIIALLAASNVFFKPTPNWIDYLLYSLGFLYIGGSNEPLAVFAFLSLIILIYKKHKSNIAIVGAIILLTSFLINYLSKGTIHREEITPGLGLFSLLLYSGYNAAKYLFLNFHFTFQIAIILSIPFYILGKHTNFTNININPTREVFFNAFLIGLVAYLNQFIVIFALGSLAPDRAAITTSLFTSIIIVRLFFLLGNYSKSTKKIVYYAPLWGCLYLMILSIYFFSIHNDYSKAVDERIDKCLSTKENPIKVNPLPESGYIYNTEITTDTNNFKNQHLKYGLGIENDVVLITRDY